MKRLTTDQRPGWKDTIREQWLVYSETEAPDGTKFSYWDEGSYYSLTYRDVEAMEQFASTIFDMLIEAGDYIVANPETMRKMGIPEFAWQMITDSWNDEPAWQSVYGRYDVRFGGLDHPDPSVRVPKLYEFNADTPTCLVESAWTQWAWLEDTRKGNDQWNSVQEKLIGAWKRNLALVEERLGHKPVVYFACVNQIEEPSGEDAYNTLFLKEACEMAGYETRTLYMNQIRLGKRGRFYDPKGRHIDVIFKLYPWEHMVEQEYGEACFADMENVGRRDSLDRYIGGTVWIEPPYKMLWSNKGILAVLWQLYAGTENAKYLIPAWFEDEAPKLRNFITKPLLGREGANVVIHQGDTVTLEVPGDYGAEGHIVQRFAPPPEFLDVDGKTVHPVCGVWMIDGEAAGLGIRESSGFVTDNQSRFVPHGINDSPAPTIKPVQKQRTTVTYTVPFPDNDQAMTAGRAVTP